MKAYRSFARVIGIAMLVALCGVFRSVPASAQTVTRSWTFDSQLQAGTSIEAKVGKADAAIIGHPEFVADKYGESILLDGLRDKLIVSEDWAATPNLMPQNALSAGAWALIHTPTRWGGIVGCLQDNDDFEKGWLLGYDNDHFYFAVSSTGADDGNGRLTYLQSRTKYELGRWYHVVGTYDGTTMRLYVNGQLDASSTTQSGDLLYPEHAPYVIGAYVDSNEHYPMHGRLREVSVHDKAIDASRIATEFDRYAQATKLPATADTRLRMLVDPYLQNSTQTSMTVMWETTRPCSSNVEYGTTYPPANRVPLDTETLIHEVVLENLTPETKYFYRVMSTDDLGQQLVSKIYTFQTAVKKTTPYAFVVIGDTQAQPSVVRAVADVAWSNRPNFAVVAGDLVSTGTDKTHWTMHFFPNMHPLIARVPFFPVLGNHERNADWYYRYMSLPAPEYYYEFSYGNAHFFMIDSNKRVDADSEQYKWIEDRLASSDAKWKFVVHHHPPFTSDENDYGDTWKGDSTQGDLNVRQLVPLYEEYGVDIVFNGHIHVYERTWPIRKADAKEKNGIIYVTTGGGGGGLEDFAPTKTWFGNTVRRTHHFCYVAINGGTLEFKAFDHEGRLFDAIQLKK